MSFLNKYRGALGLENEDLEKEVDTEQEEQVEEQSEETTENVEDQTEEQVEEQVEESTDEESKEESEEEQETVVPAEPEETTEEAIQLDDSEAPAAGGSRLQAYREAAGLVEEETVTETETETTTEEVEEQTEDKADEEEKKSAEDSEEEKEASSDEEGEKQDDESEEAKEEKSKEEESDESVKALEALRDEIMVSYQRGGMTEGEASMVNVAVNNILARNGLQAERVVPSIESFSENSTRRRLATSTTADMINRIISKIKK